MLEPDSTTAENVPLLSSEAPTPNYEGVDDDSEEHGNAGEHQLGGVESHGENSAEVTKSAGPTVTCRVCQAIIPIDGKVSLLLSSLLVLTFSFVACYKTLKLNCMF